MKKIENRTYTGERPLFSLEDTALERITFGEGESPLKLSRNLDIKNSIFGWKYPLWHANNIQVENSSWLEMARAGVWYSNHLYVEDSLIQAPKNFRRCSHLCISHTTFTNAQETLWNCENVCLDHVQISNGDYFGMNTSNLKANHLKLQGNYTFDGAKNLHIKNSTLLSKDAFWNCENVIVEDSTIIGEYIGWNSRNLTFKNCTIQSLQGFCFIENLKLENCVLAGTTQAFEYSTVSGDINGPIVSIMNPIRANVELDQVDEVILDPARIDPSQSEITIRTGQNWGDA